MPGCRRRAIPYRFRDGPIATQSWIAAGATPLPEWDLMGVVRGPREADPRIQSELWVAWARGPDGERVEGRGESPEQARDDSTKTMLKSGQAFKLG